MQNLLCVAQAGAVLLGLGFTATLGWWWVDPIIGVAIAVVAVTEGRYGLARRGMLLRPVRTV